MGVNALSGLELPTKLLFTWSKVIGAEASAAAASDDAIGDVALSVAHANISPVAAASERILSGGRIPSGLCMISLQK